MKNSTIYPLRYLFTALILTLASCGIKDAPPTTTFTGKVALYDEYGTILSDHSGAIVSLNEDASISTTTAVDGSFTLANAPLGPHRIKIEKKNSSLGYGSYYTDLITTTASNYVFPKTIRIGQISDAFYDVQYSFDRVNKRIVLNGTRNRSTATDVHRLFHSVVFNFSLFHTDQGDQFSSTYSVLRRNNLSNGFRDTISYAQLAAANISAGMMAVCTDNPMADSCSTPRYTYDRNTSVFTPSGFHRKTSPALGHTQNVVTYNVR